MCKIWLFVLVENNLMIYEYLQEKIVCLWIFMLGKVAFSNLLLNLRLLNRLGLCFIAFSTRYRWSLKKNHTAFVGKFPVGMKILNFRKFNTFLVLE